MFIPGIIQYSSGGGGGRPFRFEVIVTAGLQYLAGYSFGYVNDYYVNWGDGSAEEHIINPFGMKHTYSTGGVYEVSVRGTMEKMVLGQLTSAIIDWGESGDLFSGFKVFSLANNPLITDLTATDPTSLQSLPPGCLSLASLFSNCPNLTTIPETLFDLYPDYTGSFANTFQDCSGLTTIPENLFKNNILVGASAFDHTFSRCSALTAIPANLFKYNTLVSGVFAFNGTFSACTQLTEVPAGLFDTNVLVGGFVYTFEQCRKIVNTPDYLFRNNINAINFSNVFFECWYHKINPLMFYAAGEKNTRFLNQSVDFSGAFQTQTVPLPDLGTAPELWSCDYGTGAATHARTFRGSYTTTLTNYLDIPASWR